MPAESMDEILSTAVTTLAAGSSSYVPLSKLLEDSSIRSYFRRVLFKPPWPPEVFTMYFQSRPKDWDFDDKTKGVRVRSDLDKQIQAAMHEKCRKAPLPEALYKTMLQAGSPQETAQIISSANANEVAALPLDAMEALMGSLTDGPKEAAPGQLQQHVNAQVKCLAGIPGSLEKKGAGLGQFVEFFKTVIKFGGEQVDPRVAEQKIQTLREICELAGAEILEKGLGAVSPKAVMVLCQAAPFHIMALAIAGLGDKGDSEDVKACAALLSRIPALVLEGLSRETLLKLAVAATKSAAMAEATSAIVARACASTLPAWSVDDVAKLLLAVNKAKVVADEAALGELYGRAAEALSPQLQGMSDMVLIKVALAIGRIASMKEFVDALAAEAGNRVGAMAPPSLLLLTQALVHLGGEHATLHKIVERWVACLPEENSQLNADQLAKLAQLLAPVQASSEELWKQLGSQLAAKQEALTATGKASLQQAFPDGGGPSFPEKEALLATLKPKEAKKRSRSREGRGGGDRGGGDRGGDRDRDRDRDDRKNRSRERDARRRSRSRDRRRSRSRSRRRR